MKIAVLSDLHLGHGGRVDGFGHDDGEFLTFLSRLEGDHERIVLAGDVWETLHSKTPGRAARELERCRAAHPEIARRFEGPQYSYLHGNHDAVAANVVAAPDMLHLNVDGTRLLFMHGHQVDWVVKNARGFSEFIVWLGGWVVRLGLSPLKRLVERFEERLRGEHADVPEEDRFQLASIAKATQFGADIVVTGHTHNAIVAEHGDRLFMNSGSCAEGVYSWLSLDTARGEYLHQTAC